MKPARRGPETVRTTGSMGSSLPADAALVFLSRRLRQHPPERMDVPALPPDLVLQAVERLVDASMVVAAGLAEVHLRRRVDVLWLNDRCGMRGLRLVDPLAE